MMAFIVMQRKGIDCHGEIEKLFATKTQRHQKTQRERRMHKISYKGKFQLLCAFVTLWQNTTETSATLYTAATLPVTTRPLLQIPADKILPNNERTGSFQSSTFPADQYLHKFY